MIRPPFLHAFAFCALLVPSQLAFAARDPIHRGVPAVASVDVTGVVSDSTNGQPIESAEVTVANQGGAVVANTTTNTFGGFTIHHLGAGTYSISVHVIGYQRSRNRWSLRRRPRPPSNSSSRSHRSA